MDLPSSLCRDISPPRASKRRKISEASYQPSQTEGSYDAGDDPTLATVKAGKAKIEDHLTYFKHRLTSASRYTPKDVPRLSIDDFATLYKSNRHQNGHHFVIHQHNHPRAGVHYDLRLQFSASSSVSWALPKGLPGNPNSRQLGRMAIETRVHNLWNNLIESASMKTGSLLIWDTGTYGVLPSKKSRTEIPSPQTTDKESEADKDKDAIRKPRYDNDKLIEAFQSRHIRLRLHGARLPKDYTITLRLPSNNDNTLHKPAVRRRRKKLVARNRRPSHTSDSDNTPVASNAVNADQNTEVDDMDTDSEEDALTRAQNAYPGSTNSIGSVHQRRWFVLPDRPSSGFEQNGDRWVRRLLPDGELGGFDPFVVRGRDHERSVITGRLAREVESDEGCVGYIGRGGWKSIES
jgi:hypothetical protein